ncbi:MAG: hydroxymethylglutaryl-CoA reductase, degradative [Epsilonproteobacteria bacterium]|nr:MAG: hydroxymethylglutaryl-CoA reductase, degradative [Campylobacterota bacterium]RLA65828.1 MAG: hydroxymethylglutaryl-CoA reductase, degradative [Campylobacterota bacterium]
MQVVSGFSKKSKTEKLDYLSQFLDSPEKVKARLQSFWHQNLDEQKVFDDFSENTLTNYYFPYGIMPNLLLNNKTYFVPMVIEESSVVAAAANAASFWAKRGGVKSEVVASTKVGQVHFSWEGDKEKLFSFFKNNKAELKNNISPLLQSMKKRGGGLLDIDLKETGPNLFQLFCTFETCDAMGANFINTVLEALGRELVLSHAKLSEGEKTIEIIMAILSNYTPECLVRSYVECPIQDLEDGKLGMSVDQFVKKFNQALKISHMDIYRATTHNKGIFNGIDAVVLATGNDFRAIEACGHAFASRKGQYRGLSELTLKEGKFKFFLDVPLALGTVGGLTSLHPLAKTSLEILNNPSAKELMMIASAVGLLQNFAALKSLVTCGIQRGHMKMHLLNILNHLGATELEQEQVRDNFNDKVISFKEVRDFLMGLRTIH